MECPPGYRSPPRRAGTSWCCGWLPATNTSRADASCSRRRPRRKAGSRKVDEAMSTPDVDLKSIHRTMLTVRLAEERFMRGLGRGEFPGFYFPVRGMEAAAAGVIAALRPDDYYITTYRALADVLAKGVPLPAVFGELLGRVTGTSRGKGGTMHIVDRERGLMLTTGIVGSGTPIANGLGLTAQLLG